MIFAFDVPIKIAGNWNDNYEVREVLADVFKLDNCEYGVSIHLNENLQWVISELTTGMAISSGETKEQAIERATEKLKQPIQIVMHNAIRKLKEHGFTYPLNEINGNKK